MGWPVLQRGAGAGPARHVQATGHRRRKRRSPPGFRGSAGRRRRPGSRSQGRRRRRRHRAARTLQTAGVGGGGGFGIPQKWWSVRNPRFPNKWFASKTIVPVVGKVVVCKSTSVPTTSPLPPSAAVCKMLQAQHGPPNARVAAALGWHAPCGRCAGRTAARRGVRRDRRSKGVGRYIPDGGKSRFA
eukprot:gene12817-biopygen19982